MIPIYFAQFRNSILKNNRAKCSFEKRFKLQIKWQNYWPKKWNFEPFQGPLVYYILCRIYIFLEKEHVLSFFALEKWWLIMGDQKKWNLGSDRMTKSNRCWDWKIGAKVEGFEKKFGGSKINYLLQKNGRQKILEKKFLNFNNQKNK